jgi:catechol 2,3-dioxygenase-like lactoylglutathione lyase family enzyme
MHHIDLTVNDVERSAPFYHAVLGFLGYRRVKADGNDLMLWKLDLRDGTYCDIAIRRAHRSRGHDRYTTGLHHFAWAAGGREDVDRLHALLEHIGARILDAPAEYPQYGAGYYAVFFADPDGLKLELVYTPRS